MKQRRLGPAQDNSLQYAMSKRMYSSEAEKTKKNLLFCLGISVLMYPLPVSWCFSTPGSLVWYTEYVTLVLAGCLAVGYFLLFLKLKFLLSWSKAPSSTSAPATKATPATPTSGFSHSYPPLQQYTPKSPVFGTNMTPVKHYHSTPSAGSSPFSGSDCVNDFKSLDEYLKLEEEKEQLLIRASPGANTISWTGSSGSQIELSSSLNSSYHVATRKSPGFKDDADGSGLMWDSNPLDIKEEDLDLGTERCRKWLSQTILARLVQEINIINSKLARIGCSEQIGAVSISTLRQVAVDKMEQVPTLGQVMPYLDVTSKQDYVVQRLKDLAKGDSLAAFHWNTGGTWTSRPWDQDLPTDSQIVMHLLCSYMDAHLPPNPRHPNGRVFSSQYFLKCPYKPTDKKADICIYQSQSHPPHYQLLLQDSIIDVPKGRNNLFHCIICFLHCIDSKHNGMLGQINLGLAGINILWIISKK